MTSRRGKILLATLATVGALLVAEALVRMFDLGPQVGAVAYETFQLSDDAVLQYELKPNARLGPVVVNEQGMRGPEVSVDKPAGVFRLAMLGDSIAFGYGTEESACYARLLETTLNRYYADAGQRYQVLNFAVTGYNLTQSVRTLQVKALAYQPDAAVLGYCLNDPQEYSFELENLRARLSTAQDDYRRRLTRAGQRLALRSRLYALARFALDSRSSTGQDRVRPRPEPDWASLRQNRYVAYFGQLHQPGGGWERVEQGLHELGSLARAHELPVFVGVFPLFVELKDYPLAGIHEKVENAAHGAGLKTVPLLDLYRRLAESGVSGFAFDELHPSSLGHAYAAMLILDTLLRAGVLPVPDRDLRRIAAGNDLAGEMARTVASLTLRAH